MGIFDDNRVSTASLLISSSASLLLVVLMVVGVLYFTGGQGSLWLNKSDESGVAREAEGAQANEVIAVPRFTVVGEKNISSAYSRQITSVFREKLSVSNLTITVPSAPAGAFHDLLKNNKLLDSNMIEDRVLSRADYVLIGRFVLPGEHEASKAKVELTLADGAEYEVLNSVSGSTSFGSLDNFSKQLVGRLFSSSEVGGASVIPTVRYRTDDSGNSEPELNNEARPRQKTASGTPFNSCRSAGELSLEATVSSSRYEELERGRDSCPRTRTAGDEAGANRAERVHQISSLSRIASSTGQRESQPRKNSAPLPPPELEASAREGGGPDGERSDSNYDYTPEVSAAWQSQPDSKDGDQNQDRRTDTARQGDQKVRRVAASFGDFFWPFGESQKTTEEEAEGEADEELPDDFDTAEAADTPESPAQSREPFSGGSREVAESSQAEPAEEGQFFWDEGGGGALLNESSDLEVLDEDPYEIYIDKERIENEQKINTILRHIAHEEFDQARAAIRDLPQEIRSHPAFKHLIDQLESILQLEEQVGDTTPLEGGQEFGRNTGLGSETRSSSFGSSSSY